MDFSRAGLSIFVVVILLSSAAFGGETVQPVGNNPPSAFQVYGKGGDEVLSLDCTPNPPVDVGLPQKEWESRTKAATAVSCDVLDLKIIGPDLKKLKASQAEMEQAMKAAREDLKLDKTMVPALEKKLKDSSAGPKETDFLKRLLAAAKANDHVSVLKLFLEMDQRTCGVYLQNFSFALKRIGDATWISDGTPGGICQTVSIFKLERGNSDWDWTLTQTNLAVGGPKGSAICDDLRKGLDTAPEVFGGFESSKSFELPCDFVSWTPGPSMIVHH